MVMTDIIADTLSRIRNAHNAKRLSTFVIQSNLVIRLLDILYKEGYIRNSVINQKQENKVGDFVEVKLKYYKDKPVISTIDRVSRPGRRVYLSKKELLTLKPFKGILVLSTSSGLKSFSRKDRENLLSKYNLVGGEVLCKVN